MARSGWWRDHPADIAAEVARFDARAEAYAAAHPDSCIVVDYDEFTTDPEQLRPLFARLQLTYDAEQVRRVMATRLDH